MKGGIVINEIRKEKFDLKVGEYDVIKPSQKFMEKVEKFCDSKKKEQEREEKKK